MYQISSPYRRRNIGPLTAYGRFRGSNRATRRFKRGYPRSGAWGAVRIPRNRVRASYWQITKVVKTVDAAYQYPGSVGAAAFFSHAWQLDQIADYTAYTSIFDQYRIVGVEVTFRRRSNMTDEADTSQTAQYAKFAEDHDDGAAPSSMDTLNGYANVKTWNLLDTPVFKMFIRPSTTGAIFAGGVLSGYNIQKRGYSSPWVDCQSADVQWYGLKWGHPVQTGVTGNTYTVDFSYKVYLQFRGQR